MRGLEVSPLGIATAYASWLDRLVLDHRDAPCAPALAARGVEPRLADTLMTDRRREMLLARAVLEQTT
jgi:hypothetical protein